MAAPVTSTVAEGRRRTSDSNLFQRAGRPPSPAIVAGLLVGTVVVVALLVVAASTDTRLVSTNSRVTSSRFAIRIDPSGQYCQEPEYVPATAQRLRVFPGVEPGSALALGFELTAGGSVTQWEHRAPYRAGPLEVDIPHRDRTLDGVRLCVANLGERVVFLAGNLSPLNPDAPIGPNGFDRRDEDEIRVDFLRAKPRPPLFVLAEIARRYALVKPSFVRWWTLPLLFLAVVLAGVAAVRLVVKLTDDPMGMSSGRFPRAARWCVAISLVHASSWALLTPGFQVPDELVHSQYAQHLATTGRFPVQDIAALDRDFRIGRQDEQETLFRAVPFSAEGKPTWSPANDKRLADELAKGLPPASSAGARNATGNPPLYYAYTAAVTRLVLPLGPEDRLLALRLATALLAALTTLLAYLFVREALPGSPLAAAAGSLAVGLHPLVGFLGGGVNNDNLLFLAGMALFLLLARCFRRGLTVPRGVLMGLVIAGGMLTKSRMVLLVPVTALALLALVVLAGRGRRVVAASAGAVCAIVAYGVQRLGLTVANNVFHRTAGESSIASKADTSGKAVDQILSYAWQYFLPRLPFTSDQFTAWPQYGLWEVYITGFVGRFGWFQYGFPSAVNWIGLAVLLALLLLGMGELLHNRVAVRRRWPELATYAGLLASSLFFLAVVGYRYRADTGYTLEQTRYLFPCLAVYAGVVGLAVQGASRWGIALAGGLAALFAGHSLAAMFLTVMRYYA